MIAWLGLFDALFAALAIDVGIYCIADRDKPRPPAPLAAERPALAGVLLAAPVEPMPREESPVQKYQRIAWMRARQWEAETAAFATARACFASAVQAAQQMADDTARALQERYDRDLSHLQRNWMDSTGSFPAFIEAGEAA